jgi:hypothetical protein
MARKAALVLMDCSTPDVGPYPVVGGQGMRIAVCILMRSLDPGRNEQYAQYNTARKMRAAYATFWQALIEGQNDALIQRNTTIVWETRNDKRQGDQSYPDKAISIEVMMTLMAWCETAWEVAKGQ